MLTKNLQFSGNSFPFAAIAACSKHFSDFKTSNKINKTTTTQHNYNNKKLQKYLLRITTRNENMLCERTTCLKEKKK